MNPILFIVGHLGSGKSEFSLNFAIQKHYDVLVDLDIVNPYFRSREKKDILESNKIELISSSIDEGRNADLPYISPQVYLPFLSDKNVLFDFGGNASGARMIRQFKDYLHLRPIQTLMVVNTMRIETSTEEKIMMMLRLIESSAGIKIDGFIHNTNVLRDTTEEDILLGQALLERVCQKNHLTIQYTSLYEDIKADYQKFKGEVIPLKLYLREDWL